MHSRSYASFVTTQLTCQKTSKMRKVMGYRVLVPILFSGTFPTRVNIMKIILLISIGLIGFGTCSWAEEPAALTDDQARLGYSIGYQVGGDFQPRQFEIRPALLLMGLEDALAGTEARLTRKQMQSALMELQKRSAAREK